MTIEQNQAADRRHHQQEQQREQIRLALSREPFDFPAEIIHRISDTSLSHLHILTHRVENPLTLVDAYILLQGLTAAQESGIVAYGFSREQVEVTHFGEHSLGAIDRLQSYMRQWANYTPPMEELYAIVAGQPAEALGAIFVQHTRLTPQQRNTPHFGSHTELGVNRLRSRCQLWMHEAFALVAGRTEDEVTALLKETENFSRAEALARIPTAPQAEPSAAPSAPQEPEASSSTSVAGFNVPAPGSRINRSNDDNSLGR